MMSLQPIATRTRKPMRSDAGFMTGDQPCNSGPPKLLWGPLAAMLLAAAVDGAGAPTWAQQAMADIAYVEAVNGHVVAFAQGKPILLNALDTISDRTRLDLQANSELRICHFPTRQFLTLKGPLKASVSRDGVTAENNKTTAAATGRASCPSSRPSKADSFRGASALRL
jgi:hypothetical protein